MMNLSQTMETEEDFLSCLHIKIYHPQQHSKALYQCLPLGTRHPHSAEDPFRLGRDDRACTFALVDARVSRKQLSLQAYRSPQRPDLQFTVQNLSNKSRLCVNGARLDYLEKMELPDKALVRFGEYEMLVVQEQGEAKGSFEVEFEVLAVSPSRETRARVGAPVVDTGSRTSRCPGPLETDETLMCPS